jgi:hypothetical protein
MKTQTQNSKTTPKRRPKDLERLYLGPIRRNGLMVVVEGGRHFTKDDIMMRASAFLNVADKIKCEVCGRTYDGNIYFMVEYTGLLEKLRHAYCGDCLPEIKRIVNAFYRRFK